jgi:signal transduction histidine kinase
MSGALQLRQFLAACRWALVWPLFMVIGWGVPVQAQTLELREAHASVTVQGQSREQDVVLPYHWDRLHHGIPGYAQFDLKFSLDALPVTPLGLYLPKLGNGYEIWLNGVAVQRNGDMLEFNQSDYAKVPRYVEIAPTLLQHENLLRVLIRADAGRRAGLSTLFLGPVQDVYPRYLADFRWLEVGSFLVMVFSLLVGLVALTLWATQFDLSSGSQRRRDPLYLMAALAELVWAVGVSNFFTELNWVPWPWYGVVIYMITPAWAAATGLFAVEVAGWGRSRAAAWFRNWMVFLLLACLPGAVAHLQFGNPALFNGWYVIFSVTLIAFDVVYLASLRRKTSQAHKLVAFAVTLNVAVGVYDIYILRLSPDYTAYTLTRYSSVLFGSVLFYIVITRFRQVSAQALELMGTMASRIATKEEELARSYLQQEQMAREQERVHERNRILRDMHDGVGAHISTAIRQLQSGHASTHSVLNTMRDSLDQLKLTVDAMKIPRGDVTALLASLRYRLEPRILEGGLTLQWRVKQVPPLPGLDTHAMRQLQYLVFEAISNAMQHARASGLSIALSPSPEGGAVLCIADDGAGFEVAAAGPGALRTLRERAVSLGARLDVRSGPDGTTVEVHLPR